jgi:hypothetical protein
MITEVLIQYLESLVAFWQGLARGGHLNLIVIALVIWWLACRRGRCCCACRHCGCRCGHCRCDPDEEK